MNDTFRFLSKLSFRKILNVTGIYASYLASKWTGKEIVWGSPFNISVEPTTNCNLGCPECPSGLKQFTRPTGRIAMNDFTQIVDQLSQNLIYMYFYFQGEPYLHPQFLDLVRKASQNNIYTVTSTNGHFLTEQKAKETVLSGLDRIIISIDGTTQEVYEQYRVNGKLEKVLEGSKRLVRIKKELGSKTPHIIFQFLVVKPNEEQIPDLYKLAEEVGVDEVKLKTAQIYDYEHGNDLIPSIDKYSRYKKNGDGKYRIKNPLLNHCWKLWHSCVITWDGKVVPCCFDKDAKYQLGDMKKENFKDIWNGKGYSDFRKSVLKARSEIDICTNCTEGTKVWA